MSGKELPPEQMIASLFVGLSRREQMALLGRLKAGGANLYRALAADEKNAKAREELLKAAKREEDNGNLMRLMATPKDKCEKCGTAGSTAPSVYACSFQCTFCGDCADQYKLVCPNRGGALEMRAA